MGRPKGTKNLNRETASAVFAALADGATRREVADSTGVGYSTVCRMAKGEAYQKYKPTLAEEISGGAPSPV